MERTLDSIRPSDTTGVTNDMSYLYGRDPSILAFGQRPIPSTQQNLISLYEDEENDYPDETTSTASNSVNLQTVKVFLRMKPFPRKLKISKEEIEAYRITGPTTLVTKLPSLDHTFSSLKGQKNPETICRRFTFTQTFGPETTQFQLFEEVIQQRMVDFLSGQNCTVMTYGTTNSGKSYTLQGTTTSPGIIPRGLEFVFSNINPRPTPCYKPTHNSSVVCLNAVDRAQEIEAKNKLLTFASMDKHHYINAYKQMQKLLQEESPIRPSETCDAHYSVWVSFAEIYNENIYDLLSNDCQKRRPLLKLGADNRDRAYIKGLKTICVNSGSEAYQVLMAGQYNLKVAATALNARSSRSHCIFTIQLLKYYGENIPESVEISTFTFCDLAGSERLKKTLNVGDRLKEAQNINTSLLVLGRCLKSIYEGQSVRQRQEHIGPFRESKLTRLFQRALSGKEQIALIVNVNPIPNLYVETQNVLNFSAIAKKIVMEPKKIHRRVMKSRFSQIVAQSVKSNTDWDPVELCHIVENSDATETESVFINPEDYEDLLDENKTLKNEIGALKSSMLNKDFQIRQELTDTYTAMMKKLENDWKNRIKDVEAQSEDHSEWRVHQVEAFYKDKLNELSSRKRRRTEDSCSEDEGKDIGELEIANSRLQAKIHSLKKTMKHLRKDNETLLSEKNKIAFEFGLANDELKSLKILLSTAQESLCKDDESIAYIEGLRKQLSDKQEHVKKLKEFLNEAKEEYISISSHAELMEERLKEREEVLAETEESVADLKLLLENTNTCLDEKTKATDILEDKLNQQSNSMIKAEEKHNKIEAELRETIRQLMKKMTIMEKSSSSTENTELHSDVPDIAIKKEKLSESEGDSSTEIPKTIVPHGIFIKTDNDEILGIPSTTYDDDRESEMFMQVREITLDENIDDLVDEKLVEIREKLNATEKDNQSLRNKLSQSIEEIQSLKESLNSTKEQFNDITKRVKELKNAQDLESEARTRDDSLMKRTLEECVSLKNCESQTDEIVMIDGIIQTDAIVDLNKSMQTSFVLPIEMNKSVQTAVFVDDDLINSEKLLVALKNKCSELEADCTEKLLSISKLEEEIEKLREINNSMEQKSNEDQESIERLKSSVKTSEENLFTAKAEVDSMKKIIDESEDVRSKLQIHISKCRDEHEAKIESLTNNLASTSLERETMEKKLLVTEEARKKLESQLAECRDEHEAKIESLTYNLASKSTERETMEKKLLVTEEARKKLENQLAECRDENESKIESLTNNLASKSMERETMEKKLLDTEEARKKLEIRLAECLNLHELSITKLKKELTMTKERENTQLQSIKMHADKISDLENIVVARAKEQEKKIDELNECIERCKMEYKQLEERMSDSLREVETLKKRIQQADKRDTEKDEEIRTLQKSYKAHLSADINDKKIHEELKKNLKDLLETREALARTDELYKRLRTSSKKEIESLEAHVSSLENFKQNVKADSEKLRLERDELKILLSEKDLEMKSFMTNRDKTIVQYETLVKSLQEESERGKKEITRLQEMCHRMPTTPRGKAHKTDEEDTKIHIPVVDLSDSETKKTRRRAALPPPSEAKRSTRKKKLYVTPDESCVDLDVCEAIPPTPSPSTSTRSLRNRKK